MNKCLALISMVLACHAHSGTPLRKTQKTTDAGIAVGNLNGRVETLEAWLARSPPSDVSHLRDLIEALLMRAQFLGQLKDYTQAEALAERWVTALPNDVAGTLEHAAVRSALHRFKDAEADVALAKKQGAKERATNGVEVSILQATGRVNEALALRQKMAAQPDISSLGAMAVLYGDLGRFDEATRSFDAAEASYRDVSPFAISWLYFQQGLMWQREGDAKKAQAFYRVAVDRLPQYATAVEHLAQVTAQLGDVKTAIVLLRPLLSSSDDPEYPFQLSEFLTAPEDKAEAAALRARAEAGYDALLVRNPLAFADHAAWVRLSAQPQQALTLALQNLDNRKTSDAYVLALTAALAAGDHAASCRVGHDAAGLEHTSKSVEILAQRSTRGCQ